jgi:hypothetical protein
MADAEGMERQELAQHRLRGPEAAAGDRCLIVHA